MELFILCADFRAFSYASWAAYFRERWTNCAWIFSRVNSMSDKSVPFVIDTVRKLAITSFLWTLERYFARMKKKIQIKPILRRTFVRTHRTWICNWLDHEWTEYEGERHLFSKRFFYIYHIRIVDHRVWLSCDVSMYLPLQTLHIHRICTCNYHFLIYRAFNDAKLIVIVSKIFRRIYCRWYFTVCAFPIHFFLHMTNCNRSTWTFYLMDREHAKNAIGNCLCVQTVSRIQDIWMKFDSQIY